MNTENGKIIALDVGDVRIGIAISDPTRTLAFPRDSILRKNAISNTLKIIEQEDIALIVIGMPYLSSGSKGTQAISTDKFIEDLDNQTEIPITITDERMSSIEAKKRLSESTRSKKSIRKNKGIVDSAAAAVILQSYLDSL